MAAERVSGQQPPGPLAEEARRLAEAFSDWTHHHTDGLAAAAGTSPECRYCPLCQLIAIVRGDRPELTARLVEAGTAFADALRALLAPGATGPDPPRETTPRVQHIDVG